MIPKSPITIHTRMIGSDPYLEVQESLWRFLILTSVSLTSNKEMVLVQECVY